MDIGSLVVRIQVVADDVDGALDAAQQKIQTFADAVKSISASTVAITVNDQSLQKAIDAVIKLRQELGTVSASSIAIAVDDQSLRSSTGAVAELQQSLAAVSTSPISVAVNSEMLQQATSAVAALEQTIAAISAKEIKISVDSSELEQAGEQAKAVVDDAAMQQIMDQFSAQADAIGQTTAAVNDLKSTVDQTSGAFANAAKAAKKTGEDTTKSMKVATFATKVLKDTLTKISVSLLLSAITLVADQVMNLINLSKKQEEARQEAIKSSREAAQGYTKTATSIHDLADEYQELSGKMRTSGEENRFTSLQSQIADALNMTTDAVASQADNIDALIEKMDELERRNAGLAARQNEEAVSLLLKSDAYREAAKAFKNTNSEFNGVKREDAENADGAKEYFAAKDEVNRYGRELSEEMIDGVLNGAASKGKALQPEVRRTLTNLLLDMQPNMNEINSTMSEGEMKDAGAATAYALSNVAQSIAMSPNVSAAIETINGLRQKVISGGMAPEEFAKQGEEQTQLLRDALTASFDAVKIDSKVSAPIIERLMGSWIDSRWISGGDQVIEMMTKVGETYASFSDSAQKTEQIENAFESLNDKAVGLTKSYQQLTDEYNDTSAQKQAVSDWIRLREEYDALVGANLDTTRVLAELNNAAIAAGLEELVTADTISDVGTKVLEIGKNAEEASAASVESIELMIESLEAYRTTLEDDSKFRGLDHSEEISNTNIVLDVLTGLLGSYSRSTAEASAEIQGFYETSRKLNASLGDATELADSVKIANDAVKAFKSLSAEEKKNVTETNKLRKALGKVGLTFDGTEESLENVEKSISEMGTLLSEEVNVMEATLMSLYYDFENLEGVKDVDGNLTADGQQMADEIAARELQLLALQALLQALGFSTGSTAAPKSSGGGGGGGGKNSEDEAAKEAERLRKEAIQRDYDRIAHKRHMNEITLEQELSMLEKIRRAHRLNAEEIMDWEEKIYDLKKEIRERDEQSVDKLGDGIIDALSARYEAMLEAETDRLDASREGWEKWRDDSVKAIEDQIKALDKLADTEDREAKDAEELRKIEKLRRDIEYEQDDYNRMKLQEQLEKAIADRADRLHKLDLQDQKDALREEIESINEKADEHITALDKEQEAIEKSYEDRLQNAALQAEAERLVMQSSQEELVELLGEFAPEYDALGKTFGEKLAVGFQNQVGSIVSWFEDFNASLYEIQQNAANTALTGADAFYAAQSQRNAEAAGNATAATVNQTVNFYEPVDSPSKVARRIEEANQALGAMLA